MRLPAAELLLALCGTTGCVIPIHRVPLQSCPTVAGRAGEDQVFVRYLGVGGFLLSRGQDVIVTAPLYSNPSLVEFLLDHEIRPDSELIDAVFPSEAAQARAILVGHSHYDHLMDVPYVALNKTPKANIYGSTTTLRLLAPIEGELRKGGREVVALDDEAYDEKKGQPGKWVEVTPTLRIMALKSEHSDQFKLEVFNARLPLHLGRGRSVYERTALPRSASEWAEGTVFAYVIDFLNPDKTTAFRVYYQDSGADRGKGFVPDRLLPPKGGKAVDLAILCVGGVFDRLVDHPEAILEHTRPRFVLLAHWEDFFVSQRSYCIDRKIPGLPSAKPTLFGELFHRSDTDRFLGRVKRSVQRLKLDTKVWLTCPTASRFDLPLAGGSAVPREVNETYDCRPFGPARP